MGLLLLILLTLSLTEWIEILLSSAGSISTSASSTGLYWSLCMVRILRAGNGPSTSSRSPVGIKFWFMSGMNWELRFGYVCALRFAYPSLIIGLGRLFGDSSSSVVWIVDGAYVFVCSILVTRLFLVPGLTSIWGLLWKFILWCSCYGETICGEKKALYVSDSLC